MKLERLLNLADVERGARRRLPAPVFDVIAGGAGDELTISANSSAFDEIKLRPRNLVDITEIDTSTTVLGRRVSMPVLLGPAGYQRMAHRDAELAVARAAGAAGAGFALSTVSSYKLEDVAAEASGPKWFQLYFPPGGRSPEKIIRRAAAAGFDALCVTIDTPTKGLRERDSRNNFSVPLRISPKLLAQGAIRPSWALDFMRGGVGRGSLGFNRKVLSMKEAGNALSSALRPVTEDDIRLVRELWDGPLVIKGVLRGDQAARLVDLGADGIVVSNHGGRQLDTATSTIEVLPEVVEAVAGRAEVYLDGGVRRAPTSPSTCARRAGGAHRTPLSVRPRGGRRSRRAPSAGHHAGRDRERSGLAGLHQRRRGRAQLRCPAERPLVDVGTEFAPCHRLI